LFAGTIRLGLGQFGIFMPVLPPTPFLLLAAACYARGSQRFYCWLINSRLFGAYIRSYREGRGLPLKVGAFTITMLWLTIGLTAVIFIEGIVVRAVLLAIAVAVTVHVALLRPKERGER
jgi:uncharacterized membrane protein YbaN (DUF454 family)